MSQNNNKECPICMDDIDFKNNCLTTECGHSFHASCLMRNVAHNGFGCPYCRTALAEAVEDSDSEYESDEEEEGVDDFALRGLRFFTANLEGNEHEEEDILDEEEDMEEPPAEAEEETIPKPTAAFIVEKLIQQGVNMEYLVKALLKDHDEYDAEEEECVRMDDILFGKMRIIISNYQPEQTNPVAQEVEPVLPAPAPAPEVDYSSQPKQYANITVRRPMMNI